MIDFHTHTRYSKHATGEIEDIIQSAINSQIKILCITDHAPYFIDSQNRILESELIEYIESINSYRAIYSDKIKVLVGLEVDYHPDHEEYISDLLTDNTLDFVLGAIHYIYVNDEKVNVWDIENLSRDGFLEQYFIYMDKMICSGLFDSIAHPDTILRAGIPAKMFFDRFVPLANKMKTNNVSYEINCSSLNKSNLDVSTGRRCIGIATYPDFDLLTFLSRQGVNFTIGSDAHSPSHVGFGILDNLNKCRKYGIEKLSYYESRLRIELTVDELIRQMGVVDGDNRV